MTKVIAFPQKKQFSKEIEERLYWVAKEYIDVLYDAMDALVDDEYDYDKIEEVNQTIANIYKEGLELAIDEMEMELDSE